MPRYTFLIASARPNGNSEQLARIAAKSLPSDCQQNWLALRDLPMESFCDIRHEKEEYSAPTGNALSLFEATVNCEHLVLVTPVYWYSVPAQLKLYLDHWSGWMRVERLDFKNKVKDKTMWAISASAGPAAEAQHMFESLRLSANYMSMTWGGQVLGNGTAAGDVLNDAQAIRAAEKLFA